MKTVFKFQELWDLVEKGADESEDKAMKRENKKRDAKVLSLIQQAVNEPILDRIAKPETTHVAWEVIKNQYQGKSKVTSLRKQVLWQNF